MHNIVFMCWCCKPIIDGILKCDAPMFGSALRPVFLKLTWLGRISSVFERKIQNDVLRLMDFGCSAVTGQS